MDIWQTRRQAEADLATHLKAEHDVLTSAFDLLERCIEPFNYVKEHSEDEVQYIFSSVCSQTLIKARNYALSCYSVCLDGFHQQAGALFRPLAEALELMIYFHEDPHRVFFVIPEYQKKKLEPGHVAQAIGGTLQPLRNHLNAHASHLSLQPGSWVAMEHGYNQETLRDDMRLLFSTVWTIARQAAECLDTMGLLDDPLRYAIDTMQQEGLHIFQIASYLEGQKA